MALKSGGAVKKAINYPTEPKIKFVKKANMWCKTWFEKNGRTGAVTQKQEWSVEEPRENV